MSTLATNAITDASGGNTASINGYTPTMSNMAGRNRIINGDMRIDQRNAGASISVVSGSGYNYPVDRFICWNSTGTTYTAEQVEDAPAGFYQSTKLTFASAISLTTQNEATFQQIIEGLNVTDFRWGTANAQTITVGLWVKSSFTGTFSMGFCNSDGTRAYATTYTVNAANTWEYKTFTVAGDTSGTWLKTNGAGLFVRWNIIAGSNFQVSANNTWTTRTGAYNSADGTYGTKAIGAASSISAGSTWQITGVQLEAGSVATPFEHRQYGQELALCQRYYWQSHEGTKGSPSGSVIGTTGVQGQTTTGMVNGCVGIMPVEMRANGTASIYDANNTAGVLMRYDPNSANHAGQSGYAVVRNKRWLFLNSNSGLGASQVAAHVEIEAEL